MIIRLFFEFLKIGAFSFGGGFGTLPYIFEMARKTSWITEDYIEKILTVSQVTPGPLACNIGTIVGFKQAGILGAIICNLGFIIPAIFCMGIGYRLLNRIKENEKVNTIIETIRCSALAGIISSSIILFKSAFFIDDVESNFLKSVNFKAIVLGIIVYFIIKNKKVNSLVVMLFSAIIAIIFKI